MFIRSFRRVYDGGAFIQGGLKTEKKNLIPSHSHFNKAIYAGRGVSFQVFCWQIWKLVWNKHKLIAWSYWPYIFSEWLSKYIFVLLPIRWVHAFFFLTGGDGSFPGTKTTFMLGVFFLTITTRNKENIWSHSKPKETYCLRRPSHWKSFLIKTTAVVVYTNYSTTEPTYIINAILEKYAYICGKSLQAQFL